MRGILPLKRTRQPQQAARIDWSNPITQGLISVIDGCTNRDILAGAPTVTSVVKAAGPQGRAVEFASGTNAQFPFDRRSKITSAVSYVILADYAPVGSPNNFLFGDTQAAGAGYNGGLYSNSSIFRFFVFAGGSGTSVSSTIASNSAINNLMLGGSYDGANMRIYVNGKLEGTVAKTGDVNAGAYSLNINRYNSASNHSGKFYFGLVFNRSLSAVEHASLRANPWQIFAPEQRLWKVEEAAAPGGTTISNPINGPFSPVKGYFS